ncbi:hypothetical protein J6590_000984 [Homalodisca vitripennis]|nr:hypothetical protein J6590_000984 [Homalodisca vitripennis]
MFCRKYSKFGLNYDFKEDSLQIAKTIMLNDYFVGGIFLLYGLYFVQEDPKASIRLELYEYEKLLKLIKDERKTLIDTCQPGYLFAKLLKNNAFAFVRFSRDFSMEGQNRSRVIFSGQPIVMNEVKTFDDKSWLQGFLSKIDFIQDLKKVEQDYFKKKQKLKDAIYKSFAVGESYPITRLRPHHKELHSLFREGICFFISMNALKARHPTKCYSIFLSQFYQSILAFPDCFQIKRTGIKRLQCSLAIRTQD